MINQHEAARRYAYGIVGCTVLGFVVAATLALVGLKPSTYWSYQIVSYAGSSTGIVRGDRTDCERAMAEYIRWDIMANPGNTRLESSIRGYCEPEEAMDNGHGIKPPVLGWAISYGNGKTVPKDCPNCVVTLEGWGAQGKTYATKAECEKAMPGVEAEYEKRAAAKNELVVNKLEISCVQRPMHVWPLGPADNFE